MKTTMLTLPAAVARYFAAVNRHDAAAAAACFTPEATVEDENFYHVGRAAVRQWVEETSRKYQPAFTLMRTSVHGDRVSLAVAIAGQFPGSPVTLDYELRLQNGKIASLTIA